MFEYFSLATRKFGTFCVFPSRRWGTLWVFTFPWQTSSMDALPMSASAHQAPGIWGWPFDDLFVEKDAPKVVPHWYHLNYHLISSDFSNIDIYFVESFFAFAHLSTNEGTKIIRDIQWPNTSKFTTFSQSLGEGIQPRHSFHLWSCHEKVRLPGSGGFGMPKRRNDGRWVRWNRASLVGLCGFWCCDEGAFPCNVNLGFVSRRCRRSEQKAIPQLVGLKGIWKGNETPVTQKW